ncbi:MAG: hypothetical protein U0167_09190 [bacterium]
MRRGSKTLPILVTTALLLSGCRQGSAPDDLIVSQQTTEALVFVKSKATETLNRSWAESNLYTLSPIAPDGKVTPLTNYEGAAISDPCVSFDGKRVLFSMRPPGGQWKNIYEISADGSGLRQVTSGGGHDFDPLYLPDGRIIFTSSRDNEMDEYNHSLAEHLYSCNADGSQIERISYNQSNDFDPELLPSGRLVYTRWEHFGTMNRFPLFATNPDGTGTFHEFGPHDRNFFHPVPTGDGRLIAVESTEINGDAGPIAVLKLEDGPADPRSTNEETNWDVLNPSVNLDGAPWPHGAFKYPRPLGDSKYVASYSLPAATEDDVDYALYTFTLKQQGSGTPADPAVLSIQDLTYLYNDPTTQEYDAQLLAPHPAPPVIAPKVDHTATTGIFLAEDVFNRGTQDGQEIPVRGVDPIDKIALIAARPTRPGEADDFSANEFEKRALIGFAPVQADGSFKIEVPADTPLSFAVLDPLDRGMVTKRTHIFVRPGETMTCFGCHEDRNKTAPAPTNPNPIAASLPPTNMNVPQNQWTIIDYQNDIGPIVQAKCAACHFERVTTHTESGVDASGAPFSRTVAETTLAPGNLPLTSELVHARRMMTQFPRAYVNLSGEPEPTKPNYVEPAFPRRSALIDAVLGVDSRASVGPHPDPNGPYALTDQEKRLFNLWVLLGAQYK